MRDLPKPRESSGAIAPLFRTVFAWPYRIGLLGLYRAGLLPWQLTLLSLATNGVIGWLLITERRFLPGALLLVAGLLDIFDGGLARLRGTAGRGGAFLDSVVDRISDVILFGCLFWSLAGQGHRLSAALALAALLVTLTVSHVRAEAEAVGLERYVLLMIGLTAPGTLLPVLFVLTALGGLTVIQRIGSAWRQLAEKPESPEERPSRRRVTKSAPHP